MSNNNNHYLITMQMDTGVKKQQFDHGIGLLNTRLEEKAFQTAKLTLITIDSDIVTANLNTHQHVKIIHTLVMTQLVGVLPTRTKILEQPRWHLVGGGGLHFQPDPTCPGRQILKTTHQIGLSIATNFCSGNKCPNTQVTMSQSITTDMEGMHPHHKVTLEH